MSGKKVYLLLKTACGCSRMQEWFGTPPLEWNVALVRSPRFSFEESLDLSTHFPLKRKFVYRREISETVFEYEEVVE